MRLIIAGSRDFNNYKYLSEKLDAYLEDIVLIKKELPLQEGNST